MLAWGVVGWRGYAAVDVAGVHRGGAHPWAHQLRQRGVAGGDRRRARQPRLPAHPGDGHRLPLHALRRALPPAAGHRGARLLPELPQGVRRRAGHALLQGARHDPTQPDPRALGGYVRRPPLPAPPSDRDRVATVSLSGNSLGGLATDLDEARITTIMMVVTPPHKLRDV
eukprot:473060-Prorocentrum_minimum.AAC.2